MRFPLQCLKQQTIQDFEVFVIGDGVPESLKPGLKNLISEDERFHFVDRPKHCRRGEPYRHDVLLAAHGRIVCYLTDRDLWLPNHIEQMHGLLSEADFAHSLPLHVLPNHQLRAFPVDLGFEGYRHMMLTLNDNRIPFSCFAHTLAAYHSLPEGWTTTPDKFWTDLYMFRKFLAVKTMRGVSGLSPTAVTFPSPPRKGWPESKRIAELKEWQERLDTSTGILAFERDILSKTVLAQREEAAQLGTLVAQLNQQIQANPTIPVWRQWG